MSRKTPRARQAKVCPERHPDKRSRTELLGNIKSSINMIRYLTLAAALSAALVAQPLYAAQDKHNKARPQMRKAPMAMHQNAPRARAPIARSAPRQVQRTPNM